VWPPEPREAQRPAAQSTPRTGLETIKGPGSEASVEEECVAEWEVFFVKLRLAGGISIS